MWRPIALVLLMAAAVIPVHAQDAATEEAPLVISTVNGTNITAAAFQTRYTLEGYLLLQEITAFAESYAAQNASSSTPVRDMLDLAYPVQAEALRDPARLAETVLNSMEVDVLLGQQADELGLTITEADVDVPVVYQIALTNSFAQADDTSLADSETVDAAVEAFYDEATAFANTDRDTVRTLFRGRALRLIFYERVTADVDVSDLTQIQANTRLNTVFQQWALDLRNDADITRVADWQEVTPAQPDFAVLLADELTRITGEPAP